MSVKQYKTMIAKKRLLIFIGIECFVLVILIVWLVVKQKEQLNQPYPVPTPPLSTPLLTTVQSLVKPTIIPDEEVPTAPPTPIMEEGKIIVNDIPVADFYKTAQKVNAKGDVLLVETEHYQISYLKQFQEFKINILSTNFDEARKKAESRFLTLLDIDQVNACRLSAEVSSPQYANNKYAGMVFPLSFCADNEF